MKIAGILNSDNYMEFSLRVKVEGTVIGGIYGNETDIISTIL